MHSALWETHLRVTERQLPYGITQFYLPHSADKRANQTGQCSIYLPRMDGRLSWPERWLYTWMIYLSADSYPSK